MKTSIGKGSMRRLLFLLLLPLNMLAQDTIQMPQADLDEFFLAIDTLREQDSIKSVLIADLELQLINYKTLMLQDSTLLLYRGQEVELLNNQIKLLFHSHQTDIKASELSIQVKL